MRFSAPIWFALALSDWLIRFCYLIVTRDNPWAAYWAAQYTAVHLGLLFLVGYLVSKLVLRPRPAFGVVLVVANILFLCVLFSYQIWQIKSGSHTNCIGIGDAMSLGTERHCYWKDGEITHAGSFMLTQNAVIQLMINIVLASCFWLRNRRSSLPVRA